MKQLKAFGLLVAALVLCSAAPSPQVAALITKSRNCNSFVEMNAVAEKILAIDPKSGDAYAIRACGKFYSSDFEGSLDDCNKALSLHPTDKFYYRSALNYRYHCYIQRKDWHKALTDCLACLKVEPTPGVAHDAALLCKNVGDTAGEAKYNQLCAEFVKSRKAAMKALMAKAHDARNPAKVDLVLKELNAELQKDPEDMQALSLRADCYATKKQYNSAFKDLDKVIASEPSAWPGYLRRAEIYELAGNKKKAAEDRKKAKELGYDPVKMQEMVKLRQERRDKQKLMQQDMPTSRPRPD